MVRLVDVVAVPFPDRPKGGHADRQHAFDHPKRVGSPAGSVKEAAALRRLRCAIFCRPAARPAPRGPLRPPSGRPARAVWTIRAENKRPDCRGTAPQTRGEPGRGPNASGQLRGGGRSDDRRGHPVSRSSTGPTSDRTRSWRSARRQPSAIAIMTTVVRPSRRRICCMPRT